MVDYYTINGEAVEAYKGILDAYRNPDKLAKMAYKSWSHQRDRTNNARNPKYKWYGAKGVRVIYRSRPFVSWWINEYKKAVNLGHKWECPVVDRVDSSGDYRFDNIRLVEAEENGRKRMLEEAPNPAKKVPVKVYKHGEYVGSYPTITAAAEIMGIDSSTACRNLARGSVSLKGYLLERESA